MRRFKPKRFKRGFKKKSFKKKYSSRRGGTRPVRIGYRF